MDDRKGQMLIEAMTVWADASQRVLREMVELSTETAKEGARLYAEMLTVAAAKMKDVDSRS
jgi:hypothetical protein